MRYNLKNRPDYFNASKIVTLDSGIVVTYYGKEEVDRWFEGFEKELRQIRGQTQKKTPPNLVRIDDILGEEQNP